MFVLYVKSKVFFIQYSKVQASIESDLAAIAKLHICPKVIKMESIIGHRIDYNGVGALRGQRHISSKINPPTSPGQTNRKWILPLEYAKTQSTQPTGDGWSQ